MPKILGKIPAKNVSLFEIFRLFEVTSKSSKTYFSCILSKNN